MRELIAGFVLIDWIRVCKTRGARAPLLQVNPPLARRFCPVIQRPSGPTRNAATFATSSEPPRGPNAETSAIVVVRRSGIPSPSPSVLVARGDTC